MRGYYMRWNLVARLRPRPTPAMALADLGTIAGHLAQEDPDWNMGLGIKVAPLSVEVTGNAKLALLVLFASASLVLLIASSNVANLMLAQGAVRARELAMRAALGATGSRIVRQALTESLVLVALSAAGAVLLAAAATRLLVQRAGCAGPERRLADGGGRGEKRAPPGLGADAHAARLRVVHAGGSGEWPKHGLGHPHGGRSCEVRKSGAGRGA
jgi:hypothetical protein